MDVSILTATPIVLGVLTCTEEEQAIKRSTGDNNHGADWGKNGCCCGFLALALVVVVVVSTSLLLFDERGTIKGGSSLHFYSKLS